MYPPPRHSRPKVLPLRWCGLLLAFAAVGCSSIHVFHGNKATGTDEAAAATGTQETAKAKAKGADIGHSHMDLKFLLSMDYAEAKSISAQHLELASGARIAAESIEVLKKDKQDLPIRIRAKGKVYLETGTSDEAKVLCQEVYLTETETVLRGKPIMQRGGSIVEGLEDKTVFYVLGKRLRVIGLHRLTNETSMIARLPDLGPWTQGPNPLLPALNEGSVPANIRTEMQKAAEAEAILQKTRLEANRAEETAATDTVTIKEKGKDKTTAAAHEESQATKKKSAAAHEKPVPVKAAVPKKGTEAEPKKAAVEEKPKPRPFWQKSGAAKTKAD